MLLGLKTGGPGLQRCLDGAVGDGALAGRGATQVRNWMLHLRAKAHRRLRHRWLLRNPRLDVQLHLSLGVDLASRQRR